jgi:hypothetical protein
MVVEDILPIVCTMADGTLAWVVLLCDPETLKFVTTLAVRVVGVVEDDLLPVGVNVAVGTLSGIVVVRRVISQVARFAVGEPSMVEGCHRPVCGVRMAIDAGFWVQVQRERRERSAGQSLRPPHREPQSVV